MKSLIALLLLTLSLESWAQVLMRIQFSEPAIKQGELVQAVITMSDADMQLLPLSKLKGTTLGEVFYLYDTSPFLRGTNSTDYSSTAKLIVVKDFPDTELKFKAGSIDVRVTWNQVQLEKTEAAEGFIFEQFSVREPLQIAKYLLILLVILGLGIGIWRLLKKQQARTKRKIFLHAEKQRLLAAKDYNDVVLVWKDKFHFLKIFPEIETEFKNLESILFEFQFKPTQSEQERQMVIEAYAAFVARVSEVLRGV